jgi:hypothetical protein
VEFRDSRKNVVLEVKLDHELGIMHLQDSGVLEVN